MSDWLSPLFKKIKFSYNGVIIEVVVKSGPSRSLPRILDDGAEIGLNLKLSTPTSLMI